MNKPIHIISLGAGVQSTTMALMAACGELTPMPGAAIFADTGWEPRYVADAVEVDAALRTGKPYNKFRGIEFMHASRVPLAQIDFERNKDKAQLNLFENECEGMCGV